VSLEATALLKLSFGKFHLAYLDILEEMVRLSKEDKTAYLHMAAVAVCDILFLFFYTSAQFQKDEMK
jgi:hypothetical protein